MTEETIAYCVKCKSKQTLIGGQESLTSNGRRILKGNCKTCDCKMCKILGKKKKAEVEQEDTPASSEIKLLPRFPGTWLT